MALPRISGQLVHVRIVHLEDEPPAGGKMLFDTRETVLQISDAEQVQQGISRHENSREFLRQFEASHIARNKLHINAESGSLVSGSIKHGRKQIQADNIHARLGNGNGHAARTTSQLKHGPSTISCLFQIKLFGSYKPRCSRLIVDVSASLARTRKQQVVELWFL